MSILAYIIKHIITLKILHAIQILHNFIKFFVIQGIEYLIKLFCIYSNQCFNEKLKTIIHYKFYLLFYKGLMI